MCDDNVLEGHKGPSAMRDSRAPASPGLHFSAV
jgi:hypothetical protein